MKRPLCLFLLLPWLVLSGCASLHSCHHSCNDTKMGVAFIKGSLCQGMVAQVDKFYLENNHYPTADSLSAMATLKFYDPKYAVYRLPNLYMVPPDSLNRLYNFLYYAEKGVIVINIDYEERDCRGRTTVSQGGTVLTSGNEASQWYHTQMTCDLLFKCSRSEITPEKAVESIASWLSKMPVPADSLATAMESVQNYSLEVINLYLTSGDFSESVTLGYAWEIADSFEETLELLIPLIRK